MGELATAKDFSVALQLVHTFSNQHTSQARNYSLTLVISEEVERRNMKRAKGAMKRCGGSGDRGQSKGRR
jgi:hypothetical protein